MNDQHDNAQTDREMLERYGDPVARGIVRKMYGEPETNDGWGWSSDQKVALINSIVALWEDSNNREEGDRHRADAQLAMEAIDAVLNSDRTNGALRTFLPGEV